MGSKALGACAALACALAAQAAIIEGRVSEKQSGRALAYARVLLMPGQPGASAAATVFTDSQGRFSITAGAGAYLLSAERQGYAVAWYGQKRYGAPGTPIVVEKESRFTAEVMLSRLGALSGRVLDQNGIGLPEISVFLYRDTRPLQLAGQGVTDDRGVFRAARLEPGRYRVRTDAKKLWDGSGLLPTFYGDSVSADASQVVEVSLDAENDAVSITPLPGHVLRLSGEVTVPGAPSVFLYSDWGRRVAPVDSTGKFEFDGVAPGSYELIAESASKDLVAYTKFTAAVDMDSIKLAPAPRPTLRFRCADLEGKTLPGKDVTLLVSRTSPPDEPRSQHLACDSPGVGLMVGTWRFTISTPRDSYVSGILVQSKPSDSSETSLAPGDACEVTAVLSRDGGSLAGTVAGPGGQPAVGAMVFLRALDPATERRLYSKGAARTDQEGRFLIEGLPPGWYMVAATYDVQTAGELDWRNPRLKTVEVEAEKQAKVDLEL